MAGRTSLMSDKALNLYNGLAPAPPAEMWVSLFTTSPTVDSPLVATHGAVEWGPARQRIYPNSSGLSPRWSTPSDDSDQIRKITNLGSVRWETVTLTVSPSIVIAAGIFDSSSGDNLLTWDVLLEQVQVEDGVTYILGTGELIIRGD